MKRNADVGIVIGRFQVHQLHNEHRALIDSVKAKHDKVLVFIGLSHARNTIRNPLDFSARKRMFQEEYPDIDVYYIEDTRNDKAWSKTLDREIKKWISPHQNVMLYGGRDSFIDHYHGEFPTTELESTALISGTEIRRQIANNFQPTSEYRAGIIAASFQKFPSCYATVDVAIYDADRQRFLFGRKSNDARLRFVGGFSDPKSTSYEADARREVEEETGVSIDNVKYIGSTIIDDWRYRSEIDKVKTLFFMANYISGRAEAADDLAAVEWVLEADVKLGKIDVVDEHKVLLQMLQANL